MVFNFHVWNRFVELSLGLMQPQFILLVAYSSYSPNIPQFLSFYVVSEPILDPLMGLLCFELEKPPKLWSSLDKGVY